MERNKVNRIMKTLVLNTAIWCRGSKDNYMYSDSGEELVKQSSKLLREDGKMCCLGQFCSQIGIHDINLKGITNPSYLDQKSKSILETSPLSFLLKGGKDSYITNDLIVINDGIAEDYVKIERIREILAKQGINLVVNNLESLKFTVLDEEKIKELEEKVSGIIEYMKENNLTLDIDKFNEMAEKGEK